MPTYAQIPLAGNIAGRWVCSLKLTGGDGSDVPRVSAWDDYNMNTTAKESLSGTAGNGNVSSVCIASTHTDPTNDGWATGLGMNAGGSFMNRVKGNYSWVNLGATAPVANERRPFQIAIGVAHDFTPGLNGHDIVLGFTIFYVTPTPPTPVFEVNTSNNDNEATANWVQVNLQSKGVNTPPALPNTIYATGPDTTTTNLDPVTKPETGEKFAEEYWIQTA